MKNITFLIVFLSIFQFSCKQTTKEKVRNKSKTNIDSITIQNTKKDADSIQKHDTFNETIYDVSDSLKLFIPKNYSAISIAYGNLNLDEFKDVILVLRKNSEETTSNMDENKPDKRWLLILLGQKDGSYQLAYKNDNAVYCIDCGGVFGDPFTGITIKNGYFSIEHGISGGHHWFDITTFKYNKIKNNWYLYKDHYVSYKLNDSEDENAEALVVDSEKLKTVKDFGEISFQQFNIYSDKGY